MISRIGLATPAAQNSRSDLPVREGRLPMLHSSTTSTATAASDAPLTSQALLNKLPRRIIGFLRGARLKGLPKCPLGVLAHSVEFPRGALRKSFQAGSRDRRRMRPADHA